MSNPHILTGNINNPHIRGFEAIMYRGFPLVGRDGLDYYFALISEGKKTLARAFGRCMFFMCQISQEVTMVKYAVITEAGEFVSAKALRRQERQKMKEMKTIAKMEERQKKREAQSKDERAEISKYYENITERITQAFKTTATGLGELAELKFIKDKKKFEAAMSMNDAERMAKNTQREREYQERRAKEMRREEIITNAVCKMMGSLDASKFFNNDKFMAFLKTEKGKQKQMEELGYIKYA